MSVTKTFGYRLQNIPVAIFFILIVGSMLYITANPLGLPIPISEYTKSAYNVISNIKSGEIVLIDCGWSPGDAAMFEPAYIAVFKTIASKGGRIVMMSTNADGTQMFIRARDKIKPETFNYIYGKDYVHYGYLPGYDSAYSAILLDFSKVVSVDVYNTPISQIAMTKDIVGPTYEKIALVISISSDMQDIEGWLRQASKYHIPYIPAIYEMTLPQVVTYYPTNVVGIINGGTGAAEYEVLSKFPGTAAVLSDYQTVANSIILIFLVLGTIGFALDRSGKR